MSRPIAALLGLAWLGAVAAPSAGAQDAAPGDLRKLDLSGDWFVLIHYKDSNSENPDITKFKDFAWSIEQRDNSMTWEHYPYVLFDDETELVRRHAMTSHLAWEPDASLREKIRQYIEVSSRALTRKRLTGSVEKGFKSLAPLTSGGLNTMSFTTNYDVGFAPDAIRVVLTDQLSGAGSLEGMEESTVYEIRERVDASELRGRYEAATKRGTFRMLRTSERRIIK